MWDALSQMDVVKKMILDKIMYPTSLCEGTVSNVNCVIVFLLKQTVFVYSFVSCKKDSVVFIVITYICVMGGITISDSVFLVNLPFIRDMLSTIHVHGLCTLISIIFLRKMKEHAPWN